MRHIRTIFITILISLILAGNAYATFTPTIPDQCALPAFAESAYNEAVESIMSRVRVIGGNPSTSEAALDLMRAELKANKSVFSMFTLNHLATGSGRSTIIELSLTQNAVSDFRRGVRIGNELVDVIRVGDPMVVGSNRFSRSLILLEEGTHALHSAMGATCVNSPVSQCFMHTVVFREFTAKTAALGGDVNAGWLATESHYGKQVTKLFEEVPALRGMAPMQRLNALWAMDVVSSGRAISEAGELRTIVEAGIELSRTLGDDMLVAKVILPPNSRVADEVVTAAVGYSGRELPQAGRFIKFIRKGAKFIPVIKYAAAGLTLYSAYDQCKEGHYEQAVCDVFSLVPVYGDVTGLVNLVGEHTGFIENISRGFLAIGVYDSGEDPLPTPKNGLPQQCYYSLRAPVVAPVSTKNAEPNGKVEGW